MSTKRTTWIECRNTSNKGIVGFYLKIYGEEYFLCTQKFRKSMWNFYQNGVPYKKAIDFSKANDDHAIINVMKRIRLCISYLEKTENILIPEKLNKRAIKEQMG